MKEKDSLAYKLKAYADRNYTAYHMPGHKRNIPDKIRNLIDDIYKIDLTELDDTDSLHHAKGIIKEALDYAREVYQSDESFFLVNGSSCGVLAAIHSAHKKGKKALIAANAHISAFHALRILDIEPIHIELNKDKTLGMEIDVRAEQVENLINQYVDEIAFVYITSPSYDGVISDVESIAGLLHKSNIPLIVDEAHGAHLKFFHKYTDLGLLSALDSGADIVVQSLHKTLPSITQTAILHLKSELIDKDLLKEALRIYQSTSPSYIFMSHIDACIRYMNEDAKEQLVNYVAELKKIREKIKTLEFIKLYEGGDAYKLDPSKILLYIDESFSDIIDSVIWQQLLRDYYHIELEMIADKYIVALSSICDTKDSLDKLYAALEDMDRFMALYKAGDEGRLKKLIADKGKFYRFSKEEAELKLDSMLDKKLEKDIYIYPPGIPMAKRGQILDKATLESIKDKLDTAYDIVY